jgi:hypothetical protein
MTAKKSKNQDTDAWHPGIKSTLPSEYLPLSSMFQTENVFSSIEIATELSEFTGLAIQQLVFFRPERLVIHELLIRVSADIFVSVDFCLGISNQKWLHSVIFTWH